MDGILLAVAVLILLVGVVMSMVVKLVVLGRVGGVGLTLSVKREMQLVWGI